MRRRPATARLLALIVLGAFAGSLAPGCSADDDGDAAARTPAAERRLVLIGHPQHLDGARSLVPGLGAVFDDEPDEDDVLVVVISAAEGPMPATREAIMALAGRDVGALAILLTQTGQNDDPELQELVLLETVDIMRQNDLPASENTPVLRDTDPNLELTLKGLTVP